MCENRMVSISILSLFLYTWHTTPQCCMPQSKATKSGSKSPVGPAGRVALGCVGSRWIALGCVALSKVGKACCVRDERNNAIDVPFPRNIRVLWHRARAEHIYLPVCLQSNYNIYMLRRPEKLRETDFLPILGRQSGVRKQAEWGKKALDIPRVSCYSRINFNPKREVAKGPGSCRFLLGEVYHQT